MTFQKYALVRGHYFNTIDRHLVGHLGEFAAFIWLRDNGFEPEALFLDEKQEKKCDIDTNIGRIEVKTWSNKHWDDWGRCVAVSQLPSIKKKADIVFWCSVLGVESETPMVKFRGWNRVEIFDEVEPKLTGNPGREVNNYQLNDTDLIPVEKMGKK